MRIEIYDMDTDHFSQKEMLVRLMEKVDQTHDTLLAHGGALAEIQRQVTKTNGRVLKLEEETVPSLDSKIHNISTKQENLGVKVGAGVFVASTLFVFFLNKLF